MIKEVSGDILLSEAEVIAHGLAPKDHFTSGLALGLREEWPAMVKDFRHYCHLENPAAGGIWLWSGPGRRIANLFTQEPARQEGGHPGKASVENVNHALRALHRLAEKEHFKSIALPRLATGVGGLEWSEVRPLIDHHLGGLNIPVILYSEYHKGVKADES
jgi:O-acetyl-ADP-ribose deacetylase (regulator of RNase III)